MPETIPDGVSQFTSIEENIESIHSGVCVIIIRTRDTEQMKIQWIIRIFLFDVAFMCVQNIIRTKH